jgi:hypothetical protein
VPLTLILLLSPLVLEGARVALSGFAPTSTASLPLLGAFSLVAPGLGGIFPASPHFSVAFSPSLWLAGPLPCALLAAVRGSAFLGWLFLLCLGMS